MIKSKCPPPKPRYICLRMGPPYGGRIFEFDVHDIFAIKDVGHPSRCVIIPARHHGRSLNVNMPYSVVYERVYDRPYVKTEFKRQLLPEVHIERYTKEELEEFGKAFQTPRQMTLPGF